MIAENSDYEKNLKLQEIKRKRVAEKMAALNTPISDNAVVEQIEKMLPERKDGKILSKAERRNEAARIYNSNDSEDKELRWRAEKAAKKESLQRIDEKYALEAKSKGLVNAGDIIMASRKKGITRTAMDILTNTIAPIHGARVRVDEDQETARAKKDESKKKYLKKEKARKITEEAEKDKADFNDSAEQLKTVLDSDNLDSLGESMDKLGKIMARAGISESMGDVFRDMQRDISELKDIEKKEERYEEMRIFEDDDYRISDSEEKEKEFMNKLEKLYGDDKEGFNTMKSKIGNDSGFKAGRELSPLIRNEIRKKYEEYAKRFVGDSDLSQEKESIKKRIKKKADRISKIGSGIIKAQADFNKRIISDQIEESMKDIHRIETSQEAPSVTSTVDARSQADNKG